MNKYQIEFYNSVDENKQIVISFNEIFDGVYLHCKALNEGILIPPETKEEYKTKLNIEKSNVQKPVYVITEA